MFLAQELINDNGISTIAIGFFTALFGCVSAIAVGIFQLKGKARDAEMAALEARDEAVSVKENTKNVSNGFANSVDVRLDRIMANQEDLSRALREHIKWHLTEGNYNDWQSPRPRS
jgi:hypothetical protein